MNNTLRDISKDSSVEKGENIVIVLIIYFLFAEILSSVTTIMNEQPITSIGIARFVLTSVACIYLYKGQNWAKLFLTLKAGLGVFAGVYFFVCALNNFCIPNLHLSILTVLNGVAVYFLVFSADFDKFLKSRQV